MHVVSNGLYLARIGAGAYDKIVCKRSTALVHFKDDYVLTLFAFNGFAYLAYGFAARHIQRDLAPTRRDLRGIGRSIVNHLRFRHPRGEEAKRYNALQKFTYLTVVFVLLPLMLITGLAMSPGIDSAAPWLPDLFGGRQSARTIHFISATLLVLFLVVHLLEVVLAGFFNEMRSIITGWFAVRPEKSGRKA